MAIQNPPQGGKPEDMSLWMGRLITFTAFGFPLLLLMIPIYTIVNIYSAAAVGIIWTAIFTVGSIRLVRKRTFIVVERFGYFWDVKFAGIRLLIPFIDNAILRDDFLQKSVNLFTGDVQIDFVDASSPVDASAWYQIGNPEELDAGHFHLVQNDVLTYTYRVRAEELSLRIAEIFQGALQPLLESENLSEAQRDRESLADQGTERAKEKLKEVGVYPFPGKGIILSDIKLPQAIIQIREQQLKGAADAQEAVNRSRAYWEPLVQIKKGLEAQGMRITDEGLRELFLQLRGLETVEKTGANISFVSRDLGDVVKTLNVGSADGKRVVTDQSIASAKKGT